MSKGLGHSGGIGRIAQKHSHYEFKRRCERCHRKRAKYFIGGAYYCKECVK